jgi:hypothetical protein
MAKKVIMNMMFVCLSFGSRIELWKCFNGYDKSEDSQQHKGDVKADNLGRYDVIDSFI